MARYLVQASYTPEAWAAQLAQPHDRTQIVSQLLEQLGARFASLDYAFGDYDVVAIIEAPDNVSAAAVALAITAGGGVRAYKTTPLLTVQEALEAMRRGKAAQAAYRPPTSAVG